jgi:hypothetical protein
MENCYGENRNHSTECNVVGEMTPVDAKEPLLGKADDVMMECDNQQRRHIETDSMDVDGEALIDRHHSGISVDSQQGSSYITENTDSVAGGLGLANRVRTNYITCETPLLTLFKPNRNIVHSMLLMQNHMLLRKITVSID